MASVKHLDTDYSSSTVVYIDIDIYLYSKNPEMVTTFGYRTCHKSVYEGSM